MANHEHAINTASDELSKQAAYKKYVESMQASNQTPKPYDDFK